MYKGLCSSVQVCVCVCLSVFMCGNAGTHVPWYTMEVRSSQAWVSVLAFHPVDSYTIKVGWSVSIWVCFCLHIHLTVEVLDLQTKHIKCIACSPSCVLGRPVLSSCLLYSGAPSTPRSVF